MNNVLVKIFGWSATLIHGDSMVLDRWLWLRRHLPLVLPGDAKFLDVGCGSGAFTLGAALRGYDVVGLSWDEANQSKAASRAKLLGLETARFPICDVRKLDERTELKGQFDIALCSENIEHILNDLKLMKDIHACLKPGGRLCLSTPNFYYHPVTAEDLGPFPTIEDGRHVRRGYSPAMLRELCDLAGFDVEEITYVSYFFSQWLTATIRVVNRLFGAKIGWALTSPLRVLPVALDQWLGRWLGELTGRPGFSITMVAYKRRFTKISDMSRREWPAQLATQRH